MNLTTASSQDDMDPHDEFKIRMNFFKIFLNLYKIGENTLLGESYTSLIVANRWDNIGLDRVTRGPPSRQEQMI
jgi:hypothetical protein